MRDSSWLSLEDFDGAAGVSDDAKSSNSLISRVVFCIQSQYCVYLGVSMRETLTDRQN